MWSFLRGVLIFFCAAVLLWQGLLYLCDRQLLPPAANRAVESVLRSIPGIGYAGKITQVSAPAPAEDAGGIGGMSMPWADADGLLLIDCINVGQADTTLIRQGGHAMLFDCGADVPVSLRYYFLEQGIESFDMVWLSHPDSDHISAFPSVAYAFGIDRLFISRDEQDTASYRNMLQASRHSEIPVVYPEFGDIYYLGDAVVEVVGPKDYSSEQLNDRSLAVKISYGEVTALLCGDAMEEEEAAIASSGNVRAQILHANHHGSNSSSTDFFLRAVSPDYAVISCGKDNDYGHPGQYALRRIEKQGITVLRTDQVGTVRFATDGQNITCTYAG